MTFVPRKRWTAFIHVIICNVKWWPEFDFLLNSGTCQTIKHWIESDLIYNWTMSFQNKIGPFDWFRGLIYFCESWHFPSINIEIIRAWNKTKIIISYSYISKKFENIMRELQIYYCIILQFLNILASNIWLKKMSKTSVLLISKL